MTNRINTTLITTTAHPTRRASLMLLLSAPVALLGRPAAGAGLPPSTCNAHQAVHALCSGEFQSALEQRNISRRS